MEFTHLGNNFGLIMLFAKRDKYDIPYEDGVLEAFGEFIQAANDTSRDDDPDGFGFGPLNCINCKCYAFDCGICKRLCENCATRFQG